MNESRRQQESKSRQIWGLVGWLLLSFAVAAFGGLFMPGEWYQGLAKPTWTPPGWIFGPVWTVLYVAMAVAAWLVWRDGGFAANRRALTLYLAQLLFNALWSWIFFGMHLIGIAVIDITALLVTLIATTVLFWRTKRTAGVLLIPYLLWVAFATVLNAAIWRLN